MAMGGFFHKHNLGLPIVWVRRGGCQFFSWCETAFILIVRIWLWTKILRPYSKKTCWVKFHISQFKPQLPNSACSSNVPSVVIQEPEEEEISDDEKSNEGNCFDLFEYE